MIAQTPSQHALLRAVVTAGEEGLSTEDRRYGLGDAIALALDGLVSVTAQRIAATAKGAAFARREVFA